MDVFDLFMNVRGSSQISIITPATLPKTEYATTVWLHVLQPLEKRRFVLIQSMECTLRHRLFERFEDT